jgi:hypothetical protein
MRRLIQEADRASDSEDAGVLTAPDDLLLAPNGSSRASDGSSDGDIVIRLPTLSVRPVTTYGIVRRQTSYFGRKTFRYSFFRSEKILFSAKAKSRYPVQPVLIKGPSNPNSVTSLRYKLVPVSPTAFRLRDSAHSTLLALRISTTGANWMSPPHANVSIFDCNGFPDLKLTSRPPTVSKNGEYVLDFGKKYAVPSEKNAIFVIDGDLDSGNVITMRKLASNSYEMDVNVDLKAIFVFAIGLSLCLAKLH